MPRRSSPKPKWYKPAPQQKQLPAFVLRKLILREIKTDSTTCKFLLWLLDDLSAPGNSCYPSYPTLAKIMECKVRTVQRCAQELERQGLITIEHPTKGGKRKSNLYILNRTEMRERSGFSTVQKDDQRSGGELLQEALEETSASDLKSLIEAPTSDFVSPPGASLCRPTSDLKSPKASAEASGSEASLKPNQNERAPVGSLVGDLKFELERAPRWPVIEPADLDNPAFVDGCYHTAVALGWIKIDSEASRRNVHCAARSVRRRAGVNSPAAAFTSIIKKGRFGKFSAADEESARRAINTLDRPPAAAPTATHSPSGAAAATAATVASVATSMRVADEESLEERREKMKQMLAAKMFQTPAAN